MVRKDAMRIPEAGFEDGGYTGDGWRLVAEGEALAAPQTPAVFVIGNGFVGLRAALEPGVARPVYLNGVYEQVPIAYHERAAGYAMTSDLRPPVADATGFRLTLNGAPADSYRRIELDLKQGRLVGDAAAAGAELRVEQLASMARTAVVASRLVVTAGPEPVELVIDPQVAPPAEARHDGIYDPRVTPEGAHGLLHRVRLIDDTVIGSVDRAPVSGMAVAALAGPRRLALSLAPGETRGIELFAAYVCATDADAALADARAELERAQADGYDVLAEEQAAWFADFWARANISIPRPAGAEQALRHALFQLVQGVGRDGRTSLPAKGQTGEGYEGHVFWDADTYVLPVFVSLYPEIARAMLAWRIAGLGDARRNAAAMGHCRGALYPWRTIGGRECSSFFPAGSAQYHINADIALALRLYVETTGDQSILADGGAEMLAETARLWLEIGYRDPERDDAFVINRVTGPDEYSAIVDNNLYTNLMAAEHLRFAAEAAADRLAPGERDAMLRAAELIHLPFDERRQVYAQDEGFFGKKPWPIGTTPAEHFPLLLHYHPLTIYRHRVAKQADAVLAAALLRDRFDPAMRRRMLDTYEAVTVHDSTLSASAFAMLAAACGDGERAYRYWRTSALTDLANLFANSDHGLHMAALAGAWTGLVWGFGGMRSTEGLSFAPIAVPELGAYAFRTGYRGRLVEVSVEGRQVTYRLLTGEPLEFRHGDERLELTAAPIVRDTVA